MKNKTNESLPSYLFIGDREYSFGKIYQCLGHPRKKGKAVDRSKLIVQQIEAVSNFKVRAEEGKPFNTEYPINRNPTFTLCEYFDDLDEFKQAHNLKFENLEKK